MPEKYKMGDKVIVDGVKGEVTDVSELDGICYVKIKTRHGTINRPCSVVLPAEH